LASRSLQKELFVALIKQGTAQRKRYLREQQSIKKAQ
jgi:hypothetical protein